MRTIILISFCFLLPIIAVAQTSPSNCTVDPISSQKIQTINDKYKTAFAALREEADKGAQKIRESSPDGGAETALGIDGHVEQRRVDFSLDVPEVIMREQKVAIDLPEVIMKTQTWSYDSIRVVTFQDCRAGPDEIVWEDKTCHNDFPPFDYPCPEMRTRRGADICLPSVKAEPYREEIKLDMPETRMSRQDWILNVPEFKMTTQKFAFDYPVFIIDDVKATTTQQKKEAEDLSKRISEASQSVSAAMKSEIRAASVGQIEEAFGCQQKQMQRNMRLVFDKLTQMSAATAAGYQKAKEINSLEAVASFETALSKMKASKQQMLKNYAQMRRDMYKKKRDALAKL